MDSIIKKYDGKDSEDYSTVINKFSLFIDSMAESATDKIGQRLVDLLLLPYTPAQDTLMLLAQPWMRANVLINFLTSFNLSEEKQRVKDIIDLINTLKKSLERWPKKSLDFLTLITSSEPCIDVFLHFLTETASFLQKFSTLNFQHGTTYSPQDLQRYAIDSLFWMGKTMKLQESGKPTQLHQYIHIVTDRLYADITKDHYKYKNNKIPYLDRYEQNKNPCFEFIFNPKCSVTKDKLLLIRDFKNS